MDNSLEHHPAWPAALGALQTHFRSWARAGMPSRPDERGWQGLVDDLDKLDLPPAARDGILGWAGTRLAETRLDGIAGPDGPPSRAPKTRLLHPMEREMLNAEAYGHLLETYHSGLLDIDALEGVLEQCAQLTRLPANLDQTRALVRRALADRIAAQGFGTAH
jgi:hypothetical protein